MDTLVRVALFAPYAIGLASIALNIWRFYLIVRDADRRMPRDVSDEHRPISPRLSPRANELNQRGFRRLGEVEAVLPAVGLVRALTRRTDRHTARIFLDSEGTTEAALVDRAVEFSTRLADGSYVETMFPIGDHVDEHDLVVTRVKTSISDAYDRHQSVVAARAAEHGPPRTIASMTDFAAHDREFRMRHARRRLVRPVFLRAVLPLAAAGAFIAYVAWSSVPAIDVIARAFAR